MFTDDKFKERIDSIFNDKQYSKVDKDKALKVAEAINEFSESYQLSHSVFACDRYINSVLNGELPKENTQKTKNELLNIVRHKDYSKLTKNKEKMNEVEKQHKKSKIHIIVNFVNDYEEDDSRIVRLENNYEISLPVCLRDKVRMDDGNCNIEVIKKIRSLVAHELGHLALQFRQIEKTYGKETMSGSNTLRNEHETEANFFRDIFLEFRRQRNQIYEHI